MESLEVRKEHLLDGIILITDHLTTFRSADELQFDAKKIEKVGKTRFRGLTYLEDKYATWTIVTADIGRCFGMEVYLLVSRTPRQNFDWGLLFSTINEALKEVVCYRMGNCKTTHQNYAGLRSNKKTAVVASSDFMLFGPLFLAAVKEKLRTNWNGEVDCKYLIAKLGQSTLIVDAKEALKNNFIFENVDEIILHLAHDMISTENGLFWRHTSDLMQTARQAGVGWVSSKNIRRYYAGSINGACNQVYIRGPVCNNEPQVIALKLYSDLFKYCHLTMQGRPIRAFRALDLYWKHVWETSATRRRITSAKSLMKTLQMQVEHILQPFYETGSRAEIIVSVSKPNNGTFNDSVVQQCLQVGKHFLERLNLHNMEYLMIIPMNDLRAHIHNKLIPALKTIEHFYNDIDECLRLRGLAKISTYTTDDLLSVYASEIIALYFLYGTVHTNYFTPRGEVTIHRHEDEEEEEENEERRITSTSSLKLREDRRVAGDLGLLNLNRGEGFIWDWSGVIQPRDDGRLLYRSSHFPKCLLVGLEYKGNNCNYTVGDLLSNLYDVSECPRAMLDTFAEFLLNLTVQQKDCKHFEPLPICFRRFRNSFGTSNSVVVSVSEFVGRFFEQISVEGEFRNNAYDQWLAKWISNFEFPTDNFERLKARMVSLYEKTLLEFNQCLVYQKSNLTTYIVVPNYEYPKRVMEELEIERQLTKDQYQVKVAKIYIQGLKLRFRLENLSLQISDKLVTSILSAMRNPEYSKFEDLKKLQINVYDDLFKKLKPYG